MVSDFTPYGTNFLLCLCLSVPVAFDEDFEAELAENHDARKEVMLLAKNLDPELTEVGQCTFIGQLNMHS